jgi:hypothetical protein
MTDLWDNKIFEFLGCINKKYHWLHKAKSQLVLQRPETAMAHDPNLNPPCKERKRQHREQASLYFDDFETTQ